MAQQTCELTDETRRKYGIPDSDPAEMDRETLGFELYKAFHQFQKFKEGGLEDRAWAWDARCEELAEEARANGWVNN